MNSANGKYTVCDIDMLALSVILIAYISPNSQNQLKKHLSQDHTVNIYVTNCDTGIPFGETSSG